MTTEELKEQGQGLRRSGSVLRTFLTADVRGYTRFTQEFGDEAAARLAVKFAAVTREVVSFHGGEVIELRGDEALAVFTSARQALRSSVELQKRLEVETNLDPTLPLHAGIGIDAGEVVPVESGFRGGALNLASRLSSLAGGGEVLASDVAVRLARRVKGVTYAPRGLAELKGFADPVPVIRVLPEEDGAGATTVEASSEVVALAVTTPKYDDSLPIGGFLGALPEGPLVARDEEFEKILVAIQSVERCAGRLVLLSGEPGVGKTRLAQEVTLKVRNHGFVMATGRCYEPEASVPFFPFREALGTLTQLAPASIQSELAVRWPDVLRILPNVDHRQVPPLSADEEEQARLFWAVTGFLQAISYERPLALLLDDVHWADASTLELLQHLARHTRGHRILLLGTYRDVDVHRMHPLETVLSDLGRERLVDEVEVRRLDQVGTNQLVSATLGGDEVAEDLVQLVHRHTEGNPFFVEEVVRSLAEQGEVFKRDGRWECRAEGSIDVPKSIRSVVGQRLARLSEESQETLREASVLGAAFTFEDLLGMCGRSESELEVALEAGTSTGLVVETGREAYTFNHSLTQQTLYAELTSRRKRRLHLAAGRAIEQLGEKQRIQRVAELAWHFLEADEPEHAMAYAVEAARSARGVFAYEEAERHYRTAIELARELGDETVQVRALVGLGTVLRLLGKYDAALEALDSAVELHRQAGSVAGERWTLAHIGRVHALRGTAHEGITRLTNALDSIHQTTQEEPAQRAGLAALYTTLAHLYQETEQSTAQLQAAENAVQVAHGVEGSEEWPRILAESQMWQAAALAQLGELDDARRMLEDVLPLAERAGDPLVLSRTLNSLASVYSEAGHYDKEGDYITRALEVSWQTRDPTRIALMNHRKGWYHFVRGEWKAARTYLDEALSITRGFGRALPRAWTLLTLAQLALLSSDEDEGNRLLKEGMQATGSGDTMGIPYSFGHWIILDRLLRWGRVEDASRHLQELGEFSRHDDFSRLVLLPVTAWAELEQGHVDRAADLSDEATEMATAEGNRTILTEALRVQALALSMEGRLDEGLAAAEESFAIASSIEQPYQEARALEVLGIITIRHGDAETGERHFQAAVSIFQRLGAREDVDRLSTVIATARIVVPA